MTPNAHGLTSGAGDIEQFPNNTVELLLWASKRFETVSGHEDREVSVVLVIMSFLKHDRHQNQLIRCEFQEYCDFFRSRVSLWVSNYNILRPFILLAGDQVFARVVSPLGPLILTTKILGHH